MFDTSTELISERPPEAQIQSVYPDIAGALSEVAADQSGKRALAVDDLLALALANSRENQ